MVDPIRRFRAARRGSGRWPRRPACFALLVSFLFLAACSGGAGGPVKTPEVIQSAPQTLAGTPGGAVFPPPASPSVSTSQSTAAPPPTSAPDDPSAAPVTAPAGLPDPSGSVWHDIATGLSDASGMANAGDGSGRLFVLIRSGTIRILRNDALLDAPFLDITSKVGSSRSEQGLLGIAFHPNYRRNGFFYVNYTDVNGNTVIARYHVGSDPNQADPASETVLLHVDQPYPNHNGGSVVFGPDGYLYLGLGDGGSQGDPRGNGQSLDTLLGKILRIDVDHGQPYAIPADNPFAKGGGKAEIWAYGLRNPWRFSFDAGTHDLYIADVGQDTYEEVDYLPAGSPGGANFGWSYREGAHPFKGTVPAGVKLIDPVFEYTHAQGGCSITGGYLYRGSALSSFQSVYLFGDYCSGLIWGLMRRSDGSWEGNVLYQTDYAITSFGVDEKNEIYLVDQRGRIARLQPG